MTRSCVKSHDDNAMQVFNEDIKRLLAMDDMWKVAGRVKPVPLDQKTIIDGTFISPPLRTSNSTSTSTTRPPAATNGESSTSVVNGNSRQLKDQKDLSVKETLEIFVDR